MRVHGRVVGFFPVAFAVPEVAGLVDAPKRVGRWQCALRGEVVLGAQIVPVFFVFLLVILKLIVFLRR